MWALNFSYLGSYFEEGAGEKKTKSIGFTLIWQGGQDYADSTLVPTCDLATFDAELNSDWHQLFASTDREIFKVCLWRPKLSEAWLRLSLGSGSVWEVKNESGKKKQKTPTWHHPDWARPRLEKKRGSEFELLWQQHSRVGSPGPLCDMSTLIKNREPGYKRIALKDVTRR